MSVSPVSPRNRRNVSSQANPQFHMTFEGGAHGFLVSVYTDPRVPLPLRIDAARTCIGYEKPKLAAIAVKDASDPPPVIDRG